MVNQPWTWELIQNVKLMNLPGNLKKNLEFHLNSG